MSGGTVAELDTLLSEVLEEVKGEQSFKFLSSSFGIGQPGNPSAVWRNSVTPLVKIAFLRRHQVVPAPFDAGVHGLR